MVNKPRKKLTDKQLRFVTEYLVDFNKTRAAIRSGYSPNAANNIGYETYKNPLVRAAIDAKIAELQVTAEETTKLITDIAKGNLGDYFVSRKVEYTPRIEVPISQAIQDIQDLIEFETDFATYADLNEDEQKQHERYIKSLENQVLRYKMERDRDPKATKIIPGKTILIDKPELDIAALVKDKERGRIKSVKPTEFGLAVELYSADTALFNIAKMQGLFGEDNKQKRPQTLIIDWSGKYIDGDKE